MEFRMKRRTFFALPAIASLGLAVFSLGQSALAADPTVAGTWEFNAAASKSTEPMPRSITRTYEVVGNSEIMTGTLVTADGKTIPIKFIATVDGKDSPYQGPGIDAVAITRVDAWTNTFTNKFEGKVVASGSRVLSKDGKVMTIALKGVNPAGKPMESTTVYDRR
jgi:hypothetical protein